MRKIIFLDIDGVLASEEFLIHRKGCVDPEKISLLNELASPDTEIVISSSWGYDDGKTEETLIDAGLKIHISRYADKLVHRHKWACRGNEIEKYIIDHFENYEGSTSSAEHMDEYEYIIFDDDCDFLMSQQDNFIQVDQYTGLTESDIQLAKDILKID